MEKAVKDNKPFFCWWNSTRMHVFTHLKKESQGKTGLGVYPDGMVEHDGHVGKLLDKLDQLGIADNTIVMYSTDNGAEVMSWPDGGTTPFRGEKDTNFEGGWRVPCAIRWPGVIKPGTVSNEIFSHTDMLPTLAAAAGDPDVVEKLKKGYKSGNKTFKVHIDGYNLLPFLKGEVKENPRKGFLYWSDDGDLMALRVGNWKAVFMEQRAHGVGVWQEPLVALRVPLIYNLRSDPFERASEDASMFYDKWMVDRAFLLVPAQAIVGEFLKTFKDFPPRQKPASFSIDQALEKARQSEKVLAKAAAAASQSRRGARDTRGRSSQTTAPVRARPIGDATAPGVHGASGRILRCRQRFTSGVLTVRPEPALTGSARSFSLMPWICRPMKPLGWVLYTASLTRSSTRLPFTHV